MKPVKLAALALLIGLSACSVNERPSAIVQRAELCGAGNLSGTSTVAIQDWFSKHHECAVTLDRMCKTVRDNAPASWTDSTEGRVCTAARSVAQWIREPSSDNETFEGGWK
jgi:hypothetical protein